MSHLYKFHTCEAIQNGAFYPLSGSLTRLQKESGIWLSRYFKSFAEGGSDAVGLLGGKLPPRPARTPHSQHLICSELARSRPSHPACPVATHYSTPVALSGLLFARAWLSSSAKALAVIGSIKARFSPSPPLHPARESPCAAHCTLARLLADPVHPCLPLAPTH